MNQEEMLESEDFIRAVDQQVAERLNPLALTVFELQKRIDELENQL
jgi:hypothetical protein